MSSERPLNKYNRKEIFFWLALKRIPGIGNVIYKRLIEKFHTPEGVFRATPAELKEIEGIRPKTIEAITNNFRDEEWVNRELDRVEQLGIKILTINDRLYPQILKNIYDPPPILYVKGKIKEEDRLSISIVGSRGASAYGKEITYRLTRA